MSPPNLEKDKKNYDPTPLGIGGISEHNMSLPKLMVTPL